VEQIEKIYSLIIKTCVKLGLRKAWFVKRIAALKRSQVLYTITVGKDKMRAT
jgi:hypothetical protein